MSEQRYLNSEESRQVRAFVDEHSKNAADSDPIDDLDRILLKSEPINTIELVNSLLTTRALEAAERTAQRGAPISERARASINADDCLADLDDVLWQGVRDQAGLSEDFGEAHADATYDEIMAADKQVKEQRERAARANRATARRFAGPGFSREKTVTAEQFDRYTRRGRRG